MLRIARVVIHGVPHHITQRGNNKQDVFFVDEYRIAFLRFLKEQSQKFGIRIDGYCLMTNLLFLSKEKNDNQSNKEAYEIKWSQFK